MLLKIRIDCWLSMWETGEVKIWLRFLIDIILYINLLAAS